MGFFLVLLQELFWDVKIQPERCSFLRISPSDVNEAVLGKHGMSVPAGGLLLSTGFLAGVRLWVAAAGSLVKGAFPISCLCEGATFSTDQAFMNGSYREVSSSKAARGEPLALHVTGAASPESAQIR